MRVQFGIAHCAPQVLMTNFYHVTITILTNKEILSKQHWNGVKYVYRFKVILCTTGIFMDFTGYE